MPKDKENGNKDPGKLKPGFDKAKSGDMKRKEQKSPRSGGMFFKGSRKDEYLWAMSHAIGVDESVYPPQFLPSAIFTAFVVMITKAYYYDRDIMPTFFWYPNETGLSDFFSHYKSVAIVVCVFSALFMLLYRLVTQSLAIKRSVFYVPMLVYIIFVLLSYIFSDYRDIAWEGWNDRLEGTYILLSYMFMLFYVINTVNTEKNVKYIIYPLAVSSGILSLLGVSQAADMDFFRTVAGQKLILPNVLDAEGVSVWQKIDEAAEQGMTFLEFTFRNKEIYQTVYNIDYVSFYLNLLVPLFGMLFIREKSVVKKIVWGCLFSLLIFNFIGSASSGGFLGMFVVVVLGIAVLNKRIWEWRKPVIVLMAITLAMAGFTHERWIPELGSAIRSVLNISDENSGDGAAAETGRIDYFINDGFDIIFSVNGDEGTISINPVDPFDITVKDAEGSGLGVKWAEVDNSPVFRVNDPRFDIFTLTPANDESGFNYCVFKLDGSDQAWNFRVDPDGVALLNDMGKPVKLRKVPSFGFENNQGFGSNRGYIWSRSLPLLKDTIFIGYGADTFCIYFPHEDYIGKYNVGWDINIIVDKPHNMYIGVMIGTGVISMLALLALWGIYTVQCLRLYWREKYADFNSTVGFGIFLGVCGFLTSALVNDSSVSVMPMFYGLLGIGIAINIILKKQNDAIEQT
ncbi:MAG: O-antigen ligase family protein [Clostridiales Family XIII bacterium]|nr:O-antigen ligase family protein [Clostridiales Family XIII bacterium]